MGLFINNDEIKKQEEEARRRRAEKLEQKRSAEELMQKLSETLLYTTGYELDGYKVISYNGICAGSCVLGMGAAVDVTSIGSDFTGNKNFEMTMQATSATQSALKELMVECAKAGGNAIIGVQFNVYGITNMIGVTATGTSVTVEKL